MRIDRSYFVGSRIYRCWQETKKKLATRALTSTNYLQLGLLNKKLCPYRKWERLIWLALALVPYIQHELWLYVILTSAVFIPNSSAGRRLYIPSAILWLGWGFLNSLWAPEPVYSIWYWLRELPVILGGAGVGVYLRRKPVGWGIIVACSLPVIFLGIIQAVKGISYPAEWVSQNRLPDVFTRITGTLGNPNLFGEYISFLIPITLGLSTLGFSFTGFTSARGAGSVNGKRIRNTRIEMKTWVIAVLIGYISALYLTFSRTSWVATIAGVLLFFIAEKKEYLYRGGIILIILLVVLQPLYLNGALIGLQSIFSDSTVLYRFRIWEGTWDLIKNFPYIGVGNGNFLRYYPYFSSYNAAHAHNLYLQIMAERGALGLLVFLLLLLAVFSISTPKILDRGVKVALITQMVAGLTESVWTSPLMLFLFWTGYGFLMGDRDE